MGLHECGISEDRLPPCWRDDVRMNALFAPFRLKIANPESWQMKMKFWSDMLRDWCRTKGDAVVSAADARVAFQRKGRTPACMDIVVEEMYRNGDLVPIYKYQQMLHSGPEGWVMWGARLAFKPAAIALTAVTSLMNGGQAVDNDGMPKATIEATQRFVMESVLKEQGMSLLSVYPQGLERVGTTDELMRRCEWKAGREAFEIALGWLVANGSAVVKGDVIKLAEPSKKVTGVSQAEEALVSLTQSAARLQADAARLSREVDAAHADARCMYAMRKEPAAKNHLRRKHRAQQRLRKCEDALENVTTMLQNLRDTDAHKAIVDTYKTTSAAMRVSNLDEDMVHNTMDELKDVMDSYNEVEKALSGTIEDVDTAELEEELRELLGYTGPPGGGTPGKEQQEPGPSPKPIRPHKNSEREFVFDGEERILAELNKLGIEDASPPVGEEVPKKVPVAEWDAPGVEKIPQVSSPKRLPTEPAKDKPWYPPIAECIRPDVWNNNYELRQDERLHPGQTLNIDHTSPPRLYNMDFQVRDHKLDSRVWLYNPGDANDNAGNDTLGASTQYTSSDSPGKTGGNFQMAPGGERHSLNPNTWPMDDETLVADIERRLNNLRKFNL